MKRTEVLFRGLILLATAVFISSSAYAEQDNESLEVEVTPSILSKVVKGDKEKFEEDKWVSRNTSGGLSSINFSKYGEQDALEFEGKGLAGTNDYDANFSYSREGVGSFLAGFRQFVKYYDGTGGYYGGLQTTSFHPAELDNNLRLNIGDFKLEGILAKEDSPEYSLGYEREFRHGSKSLVSWGSMTNGFAVGSTSRNINPTYIDLDETVDKLKLGYKRVTKDAEVSVKQIWESARSESAKVNNQTTNIYSGSTYNVRRKSESLDSDLYSTQAMLSKDLNKNLFMSCGLLYNHYVGGSLETITDTSTSSYNENHPLNPATVNQDTVTLMPNVSFNPLKDLQVGLGLKAEIENKASDAAYNRDYRTSSTNFTPDGIIDEYVNIVSDTSKKRLSENVQFKYSRLKSTVFYGGAELEREFISQFEVQDSFGPNPSSGSAFSRKTNGRIDKGEYTLGAKWYPLTNLNITVEDKYKSKNVDNHNEFLTGDVTSGYRGFIDSMRLTSNTPTVKLSYKPYKWIQGTFGYIYERAAFGIRTKASDSTEYSKQEVFTYTGGLTFIPAESFYCTLFYERRNDRTITPASGTGGGAARLSDFEANADILGFDYSYAVTKATALTGGYSMSYSGNFNDYSTTGLPLGTDNFSQTASLGIRNSLSKDRSVELKYSYSNYEEDSNNHIDDYEAHLIGASMKLAF